MDIYFSEEQKEQAIRDICYDEVFDDLLLQEPAEPPAPHPVQPVAAEGADRFALRRAQLIASRPIAAAAPPAQTVKEKIKTEIAKFVAQGRGIVDCSSNPQLWWRENAALFPLLARYYQSHCAFPATSTASERVFNCEGLVVTNDRY